LGGRGRFRLSRLTETHGDARLPALVDKLTGRAKEGHTRFSDRCEALDVTAPENTADTFREPRFTPAARKERLRLVSAGLVLSK
jgi:hypothetical protein